MTHVLVVDDDPSLVLLLQTVFVADDGEWSLDVAHDGADAIALLAQGCRPDVVVLDVMMPNIGGLEVLAWIRGHDWLYDVPVLLLTARSAERDVLTGWQAGCDAYLTKPFEPEALVATCGELVHSAPELRVARRQRRLAALLAS